MCRVSQWSGQQDQLTSVSCVTVVWTAGPATSASNCCSRWPGVDAPSSAPCTNHLQGSSRCSTRSTPYQKDSASTEAPRMNCYHFLIPWDCSVRHTTIPLISVSSQSRGFLRVQNVMPVGFCVTICLLRSICLHWSICLRDNLSA